MEPPKNYAILTNNTSKVGELVQKLLGSVPVQKLPELHSLKGMLFSRSEIDRFMDEEERHDLKILTKGNAQSLKTMSSGEQKKALLNHLLDQDPDFLILVNPYDNLDTATQATLKDQLCEVGQTRILVQLVSRLDDILPTTTDFLKLEEESLHKFESEDGFWSSNARDSITFNNSIPHPIDQILVEDSVLINFKKVSVSFDGRQVLNQIDWTIKKGEFWQLIGPNGSGKSTLLSMITGDSHKGYGQDLTIFGRQKGSGESVWDIKQNIGYYAPAITDKFRGYHTLEHMVISGLHDSIGLYVQPSDTERHTAHEWLTLLNLHHKKDDYFRDLSVGDKRLVMMSRAMIKHPPLLILDEPTAGLDDSSAALFVALVNKIAQESDSAIVFVSHRKEPGLHPEYIYELQPAANGSKGVKIKS